MSEKLRQPGPRNHQGGGRQDPTRNVRTKERSLQNLEDLFGVCEAPERWYVSPDKGQRTPAP